MGRKGLRGSDKKCQTLAVLGSSESLWQTDRALFLHQPFSTSEALSWAANLPTISRVSDILLGQSCYRSRSHYHLSKCLHLLGVFRPFLLKSRALTLNFILFRVSLLTRPDPVRFFGDS